MKNRGMNSKEIEDLLDSDDELPVSYNEDPIAPAYKNDNRFDPIIFKWINNTQKRTCFANNKEKPEIRGVLGDGNNSKYITKGFLNQQDLFCLKSVSETPFLSSRTDIFLWLVDFLVRKDIQSRYGSNLKSCLVSDFPCTNVNLSMIHQNYDRNNICKRKYKIVVKI